MTNSVTTQTRLTSKHACFCQVEFTLYFTEYILRNSFASGEGELLPKKVLDPELAESELHKLRSPHLWSRRTVKDRILTIHYTESPRSMRSNLSGNPLLISYFKDHELTCPYTTSIEHFLIFPPIQMFLKCLSTVLLFYQAAEESERKVAKEMAKVTNFSISSQACLQERLPSSCKCRVDEEATVDVVCSLPCE